MTDNDPKQAKAADEPANEAAPLEETLDSAPNTEPVPTSGWAKAPDPASEIARLEAEKTDLTDRLVRLAAEMDNLRKRTERDVADARRYAVTKFAGDMLTVSDNLKRALAAVPADRQESGDEILKALAEGVEVTDREMDRLLAKNGITRIAAIGDRFDPHRHQAIYEMPDPTAPAGTVVEVVQDGYQIGDRVLRAALVGVAKGGAAAGEATREESEADTAH